jgi:hypothetical protein
MRRAPSDVLERLEQITPTLDGPISRRELARRIGRDPTDKGVGAALADLVAIGRLHRGRRGYERAGRHDRDVHALAKLGDLCACARPLVVRAVDDAPRCAKCGREPRGDR